MLTTCNFKCSPATLLRGLFKCPHRAGKEICFTDHILQIMIWIILKNMLLLPHEMLTSPGHALWSLLLVWVPQIPQVQNLKRNHSWESNDHSSFSHLIKASAFHDSIRLLDRRTASVLHCYQGAGWGESIEWKATYQCQSLFEVNTLSFLCLHFLDWESQERPSPPQALRSNTK